MSNLVRDLRTWAPGHLKPLYRHSHADLGTAFTVRYEESNIRDIQALIIGPPGTPYELGFYEVRDPPIQDWPELASLNYSQAANQLQLSTSSRSKFRQVRWSFAA